jgi:hypothetical protein
VAAVNSTLFRRIVDIAIFQAAWFACVLGAARGATGLGEAAVAGAVAWQLGTGRRYWVDLLLMAAALGTGLVWDTFLGWAHIVVYASPASLPAIAPTWILALWVLLGSVLREPLRWLQGRPWLAVPFGAVGGAASYAGAARLGACAFPDEARALAVLAAGWGVIFPLLSELARRLDARAAAPDR